VTLTLANFMFASVSVT